MYYTACLLLTIQWQLLYSKPRILVGGAAQNRLGGGGGGGLQPQQPP